MGDLRSLFRNAVTSSLDTRGKPAVLGKVDGTLYYSSTRRDLVWARIGEEASYQENIVRCLSVTPQYDMPVRVDQVNDILTVISTDDSRYLKFSGNRPGGSVGAHAWLHGRLGPDPLYITGLQYLPLLVLPSNPADLTVTVKQGAYRWDGTYKIFEESASGSLSSYLPGSSATKHFVIIALDRTNNTIVIVDGSDVSGSGGDALFGSATVSADDVTAVSIADDYYPLAVVLLYYGQTEVRAADIVMDLRPWGGEDYISATTIPEPPDDSTPYGRMVASGTPSWVAVVPESGGQFTGDVGIGTAPTVALEVSGETILNASGRYLYLHASGGFNHYMDAKLSTNFSDLTPRANGFTFQTGPTTPTTILQLQYSSGNKIGFFGATPVSQQNAVKATTALQNLGLGTSLIDYVAATGGTFSGNVGFSVSPSGRIHTRVDGGDNNHFFENYSDTASQGSVHILRRARGSAASPSAVQSGDRFGGFAFGGYDGGFANTALIASNAGQNWSSGNHGTYIVFETTVNASASRTVAMTLQAGLQVGSSPTGGDKGAGTINVSGDIYKNNSAYTNPDYVLEKHFTGQIVKHANAANQNYYGGLVPLHELEDYLRENWHLPNRNEAAIGIFGRADWVQEKLEELALYICQLYKEIEVLKNG